LDRNHKIAALILLLNEAKQLAARYTGGVWYHFDSAEDFHRTLKEIITHLRNGDVSDLDNLQLYFAPTGVWDQFIRSDGEDMANKIYELLKTLPKAEI